MRRVVVTGMGGVTALGNAWESIESRVPRRQAARVRYMTEWDRYVDMGTRLGRALRRLRDPGNTGPASRCAAWAACRGSRCVPPNSRMANAGLAGSELVGDGSMGVACGSCIGSTADLLDFAQMLIHGDGRQVNANSYIRMMPHTAAANIGIFFGMKGRVIPTNSACTSGSQAIGYAYEAILHGSQTRMLAGGAEELCPTQAKAFDTLYATSRRNDDAGTHAASLRRRARRSRGRRRRVPSWCSRSSRPRARVARRIHAEILGYSTNSDGTHVTRPEESTMRVVMENALTNARVTRRRRSVT